MRRIALMLFTTSCVHGQAEIRCLMAASGDEEYNICVDGYEKAKAAEADARIARKLDRQIQKVCRNPDKIFADSADCVTTWTKVCVKIADECRDAIATNNMPWLVFCSAPAMVSQDGSTERCLWRGQHPVEDRCEKETEAREQKTTAYYACVEHYKNEEWRETQAENERRKSAIDAQRAEDQVWVDALNNIGESFKPKPTTTCTTQTLYDGVVQTVCH